MEEVALHGTRQTDIVDQSLLALRARMVRVHLWLTYAVCIVMAAFISTTWNEPHTTGLVWVTLGYLAVAVVVSAIPTARMIYSSTSDYALLAWSVAEVALISAFVMIDEAATTPVALLYFIPVLAAALSYPLLLVVGLGTIEVLAYIAVNANLGTLTSPYVPLFAFTLGVAALACAWQARVHEQQRRELVERSRTDSLTGCLNRRGFYERLDAALDESRRLQRDLSVVMLDLDDFKAVNDADGHVAGDDLLCWMVGQLQQGLRPMDALGRLGGDEFAVLLPMSDEHECRAIMGHLRSSIAGRAPASMGAASFPRDGLHGDQLLQSADRRLYDEKNARLAPTHVTYEASWAAAFGRAVDARMAAPDEHSQSVARRAARLGRAMGLGRERLERLELAGLLHDVGFVLLPDDILHREGPLSDDERASVGDARVEGAALLARIDGLTDVARFIRHCHEHFDGSGRPDGLAGEDIPLESRVLFVADSYDAMRSDRPYRPALSHAAAIAELRALADVYFDPACIEVFARPTSATGVASDETPSAASRSA